MIKRIIAVSTRYYEHKNEIFCGEDEALFDMTLEEAKTEILADGFEEESENIFVKTTESICLEDRADDDVIDMLKDNGFTIEEDVATALNQPRHTGADYDFVYDYSNFFSWAYNETVIRLEEFVPKASEGKSLTELPESAGEWYNC